MSIRKSIQLIFSSIFLLIVLFSCTGFKQKQHEKNNIQSIFSNEYIYIYQYHKFTEKKSETLVKGDWNFFDISVSLKGKPYVYSKNIYKDMVLNHKVYNDDDVWYVFISVGGAGSGNYGTCYVFVNDNGKFKEIIFPKIAEEEKKIYNGHDNFDFFEKTILRRFPVYQQGDAECCPTGGEMVFSYTITNKVIKILSVKKNQYVQSSHGNH